MMQNFRKFFLIPTLLTLLLLCTVFYFNSLAGLFAVLILIVLEVTLSFDNAIINAKVLEKMDDVWRHRFITWGIWFAVFGTRVFLPIIIVSLVTGINIFEVTELAIFDPVKYGEALDSAHYSIGAFGGIFLMLVALTYFIDDNKDLDWIKFIEKRIKKFSSIQSFEIVLALVTLLLIAYFVPLHANTILVSGIIGVVTFVLTNGVTNLFEQAGQKLGGSAASLFLYLCILDVAFSLDGVIGAFAISNNLLVIATGLGVGALFVREFTLMLVETKSLKELVYLEHGAHYAILGLGLCMLLNLIFYIGEIVTGFIGLVFVSAAYISSIYYKKS